MTRFRLFGWFLGVGFLLLFLSIGCSQDRPGEDGTASTTKGDAVRLALPDLSPADLEGEKLRVVATTSIIGDVAGRVGGEVIELVTLIEPGQDPHSYEPTARVLTTIAKAHVILANGWNLEEGLIGDIKNVAGDVPLVEVSSGIRPIPSNQNAEDESAAIDPHTWLDPHHARQWVINMKETFTTLDPANAASYESNAASYLVALDELIAYYDQQVETIPADQRKLATNHDSLRYFVEAYGFEIVGTVIPAVSSIAEPSSGDLVRLVDQMKEKEACTIFADTTANKQLAETVTAELVSCDDVQVITLNSGSLGPVGSETDNYLGMMRANIDAIVGGLRNTTVVE